MELDEFLLPDEGFADAVETVIKPYLAPRYEPLAVVCADGQPLSARVYAQPGARAVVCLCHGYCEYADKYLEVIYCLLRAGYSVAICEHRGHGFSPRTVENLSKVHIDSYDTYVRDYDSFTSRVEQRFAGLPLYLFGHSMGGCVAALYLEQHPGHYRAAVLSSPMFQINTGGRSALLCRLYGHLMIALGRGEQYLGSQEQDFSPIYRFETSSCTCRGRYDAWFSQRLAEPHYQSHSGTIRWMTASLDAAPKAVRQAGRITVPLLLCQAGQDRLVKPGGQQRFARRAPDITGRGVVEVRHVIFNSLLPTRRAYWQAVLAFYAGIQ